jgi:hypothetical protein
MLIAWHPRCTAVAADGTRKPQEDQDVTASYDDIAAQLAPLVGGVDARLRYGL